MTKEELEKEAEEWVANEIGKKDLRCVRAYIDSAEPREKQIQIDAEHIIALQKQNGELTDKVNDLEDKLANADYQLEGRDNEIRELKEQIEKMKCCGDCENGELSAHEEPCQHCQRCFASKDVTDQENVKDNWEAIKEITEK